LRHKRIIETLLLVAITISLVSVPLAKTRAVSNEVILIRVTSTIDYKIADLITNAVGDVEQGDAVKLLVEIDTATGYYAPSMQLVDQLSSIRADVVAYVGPAGAVSSSFSTFLAMVSGLLAMNAGTTIGNAAAEVDDPSSVNYLAGVMQSLAVMNGRNALAAAQMVTANVEYSADTAYSKRICDLVVDSYGGLLTALGVDPANVVEMKPNQYPSINSDVGNELVRFFGDPFVLRCLFVLFGFLVMINLLLTLTRPKKSKLDDANRAIFELIRMEVLSPDVYHPASMFELSETPLHTSQNTPSTPAFKMSRVPTHPPDKRVERPIEVKKR
jgi:membrane-bound ClpP family serine protease